MSTATSGFLFGNVGADNVVEADDGPLDKATREALASLPPAMLNAASLLDDEDAEETAELRHSSAPIEKARDAQDYSGERELAEEVPLSASLQKPVALDADDYDAPAPSNHDVSVAPAASGVPASSPDAAQASLKRKEIEMPPMPLNLNNIRFSDLFVAPSSKDAAARKQRRQQQAPAVKAARPLIASAADLELDETELLITNIANEQPPQARSTSIDTILLPDEDDAHIGDYDDDDEDAAAAAVATVAAEGTSSVVLPRPPPEPAYMPVQQLDWEENIIWSDSEAPKLPPSAEPTPVPGPRKEPFTPKKTAESPHPSASSQHQLQLQRFPHNGNTEDRLFDDVNDLIAKPEEKDEEEKKEEEKKEEVKKEEDEDDEKEPGETDDEADKEKSNMSTEQASLQATPLPAPPAVETKEERRRKRVFRTINEQLAQGDWAESIAWTSAEAAKLRRPLILDMNDRELLFETVPPPTLPTPSSAAGDSGGKNGVASNENAPTREARPKSVRKLSKSGLEVEPDLPRTQTVGGELNRNAPLDPFNISLDRFYATTRAKSSAAAMAARAPIQHAVPALKLSLVKTHLVKEDLVDFHRPKVNLAAANMTLKLLLPDPPKPIVSSLPVGEAPILKKKSDLSGKDNRVVLMEYLEEYPLFVQNVGMASRVVGYWRRPRDPTQASNTPPKFADGDTVTLEPGDPSPLFGEITADRPVQSIENKLFKAPIVPHTPPSSDFLLIRSKHSNKVYVREITATYVVGQLQPAIEVPAPNSRPANIYVRNRLQGFIFRLFKKKSNTQHRLRIADLCSAFPNHSETSIRKRLKECADFQRAGDDSGWWTVKEQFQLPTEEELRAMLTPEMTCAFESMLVGHQRLQDYGIDRITTLPGLTTAIAQLDQQGDRSLSEKARLIEEQLKLTPWNLSSSFLSAVAGRAQLQLTGAGDPTGRGEGFSFLRVTQKPSAPKPKGPPGPKVIVTGTDADLRKLSLEQARQTLLKFGIPDEKVQQLGRWDRIALIRKMSSEAAATGEDANMTKFARGARYTAHLAHQQYKDAVGTIFQQQLSLLSRTEEEPSDDEMAEAEDAQLAELEKGLEADLLRTQNIDEREDEAELKRLLHDNEKRPGFASPPDTPASHASDVPPGPPRKKVQYLRRTVTVRNPDGTETKKVDIIKDQAVVQAYLAKQSTALEGLRKLKTHLTADEEDQKNRVRKERRRLQEQLRRLRRNQEKQAANRERLLAGEDSSVQSSLLLKCGACGMTGHMRTNRNCPLYEEPKKGGGGGGGGGGGNEKPRVARAAAPVAAPVAPPQPPTVKAESSGTKLKLFRKPDAGGAAGAASAAASAPSLEKVKLVMRKDFTGGSKKRSRDKNTEGAFDAEDEFIERSKQQGRRRKAEGVQLANRIEQLWNEVKDNPYAAAFQKPVNSKQAPDYTRVIARPIDLSTMRDRIRSFGYNSIDDFLADMRLMTDNCHRYCETRHPHLPPQADMLLRFAEERAAALKAEIANETAGGEDEGEQEDAVAEPPESPHHGTVIVHALTPPQPTMAENQVVKTEPMND